MRQVMEYHGEEEVRVAAAYQEVETFGFRWFNMRFQRGSGVQHISIDEWKPWTGPWSANSQRHALFGGWESFQKLEQLSKNMLLAGWRSFIVCNEDLLQNKSLLFLQNELHSLHSLHFAKRIAKIIGISPVELFKFPTIASLAESLRPSEVTSFTADLRRNYLFCIYLFWRRTLVVAVRSVASLKSWSLWTGCNSEEAKNCFWCCKPATNARSLKWRLVLAFGEAFFLCHKVSLPCAFEALRRKSLCILTMRWGPLTIVGFACRLPNATSAEQFLDSLQARVLNTLKSEAVRFTVSSSFSKKSSSLLK